MSPMTRMLLSSLLPFASIDAANSAIINVPAQQSTIQAAINVAVPGDVVQVAPGTYAEKINFQGKAIKVRSTGGATVTTINATGLAGSVVTFDGGEGPNSVLDGFTLTGGIGTLSGANRQGGGIYLFASDPTIRHCVLRNNTADLGGGIRGFVSDPLVLNCVFRNNQALRGAAICNDLSNPVVLNCTISGNSAALEGGGIHNAMSFTRLINCVVWNNSNGSFSGDTNPIVTHSDVQGGVAGNGNIDANPLFVDAPNGDLRLLPGSPCIDAGDSTAIASSVFVDLTGSPRGVNDPAVADTGIPVFGLTVDLGAFERQAVACAAADSNGDGVVNIDDLVAVITHWGACAPFAGK